MNNNQDILPQLISKGKEFCSTLYMLLDKLSHDSSLITIAPIQGHTEIHTDLPNNTQTSTIKLNEDKSTRHTTQMPMPVSKPKKERKPKATKRHIASEDGSESGSDYTQQILDANIEGDHIKNAGANSKPSRYNGYLMYYKSIVAEIKASQPHISFPDLAKLVSSKWKSLSSQNREQWNLKCNPKRKCKNPETKRKYKKRSIKEGNANALIIPIVKKEEQQPLQLVDMAKIKELKQSLNLYAKKEEEKKMESKIKSPIYHDAPKADIKESESISIQRAELKKRLLQLDNASLDMEPVMRTKIVQDNPNASLF